MNQERHNTKKENKVTSQVVVYCDKDRKCCINNESCTGTFYYFPDGTSVLQYCGCH